MYGFKLKQRGDVWSVIGIYPVQEKDPEYRLVTRAVVDGKEITFSLNETYEFQLHISNDGAKPTLRFDTVTLKANTVFRFNGFDRIEVGEIHPDVAVVELELYRNDGDYPVEGLYMNGELHSLDEKPEKGDIPDNAKPKIVDELFDAMSAVPPVYINLAVVGRWLREDRDGYSRTEVLLKHLCGIKPPKTMEMALMQSALTTYQRGLVELNPTAWKRVEMPCNNYTALMRAVVAEAEPWTTNQANALRPLLSYFDQRQHPFGEAWRFRHDLVRGVKSMTEGAEGMRFGEVDDPHRMTMFNVEMNTVIVFGGEAFVVTQNQAGMIGEVYGSVFGIQGLIGAI